MRLNIMAAEEELVYLRTHRKQRRREEGSFPDWNKCLNVSSCEIRKKPQTLTQNCTRQTFSFSFKNWGMGPSEGGQTKARPKPGRETPNPEALCVAWAHDVSIWALLALGSHAFLSLLRVAYIASLLCQLHSMPEAFLGGYPTVLASSTSWELHFNLFFISAASCNDLSGPSCREHGPASHCPASVTFWNPSVSLRGPLHSWILDTFKSVAYRKTILPNSAVSSRSVSVFCQSCSDHCAQWWLNLRGYFPW